MKISQHLLLALVCVMNIESMRIKEKVHHRSHNKLHKASGSFSSSSLQKISRDENGECIWGETLRQVTEYPTIVKDKFKPSGEQCVATDGQATCRTNEEVLDQAAKQACVQRVTDEQAVYYVNTRRMQRSQVEKNKVDMLSQFTYAILPNQLSAITEDVIPVLFTVVVPASVSVEPYVLTKCPFDFSMGFDEDMEDQKSGDCFYNLDENSKVTMKFHESEDFKKYQAQKDQKEQAGMMD